MCVCVGGRGGKGARLCSLISGVLFARDCWGHRLDCDFATLLSLISHSSIVAHHTSHTVPSHCSLTLCRCVRRRCALLSCQS